MRISGVTAGICTVLLAGCALAPTQSDPARLEREVDAVERAFAQTMADRDLQEFASFLSEEAVFFSGSIPLRGKQRVIEAWQEYYESPDAPFSWGPETIQVLESGKLALSSGPVRNPDGVTVATFTSIWRLEAPGVWRIVFDKGNAVCDDP